MDPQLVLHFFNIIFSFFSFFCQDANKRISHCVLIDCNLSKKYKLILYKTQNRESNYVDYKFFFNFCQDATAQKFEDRRPNTIELTSQLVHVLCDFKAIRHQEASVSLEYIMKIHFADYLFGKSSPCTFPLQFKYIYFLLCILLSQN